MTEKVAHGGGHFNEYPYLNDSGNGVINTLFKFYIL
jgi:hypothetical protein